MLSTNEASQGASLPAERMPAILSAVGSCAQAVAAAADIVTSSAAIQRNDPTDMDCSLLLFLSASLQPSGSDRWPSDCAAIALNSVNVVWDLLSRWARPPTRRARHPPTPGACAPPQAVPKLTPRRRSQRQYITAARSARTLSSAARSSGSSSGRWDSGSGGPARRSDPPRRPDRPRGCRDRSSWHPHPGRTSPAREAAMKPRGWRTAGRSVARRTAK